MIEKILERLEERKSRYDDLANEDNFNGDYEGERKYTAKVEMCEELIEIVQKVAKEYGGGWIPVETELPPVKENPGKYDNPTLSEDVFVIYKTHGFLIPSVAYYVHNKKCWECSDDGRKINVVKWMPIPPYQKGE